jgi:23S rRNA (cytosine1962-C5)-methyltransferase
MAKSGKTHPVKPPPAPARNPRRQPAPSPEPFPAPRPVPDPPQAPVPGGARITRRAADRLRAGHVWVYASDVERITLPEGAAAPALLPVADGRGLLLGTALYSPTSQIALRMVSRGALDEAAWLTLLAERLRRAIDRRLPMLSADNDACRLCFSEADELPGLIVDKYGDLVVLQLLSKGLDRGAVRETCARVLREELAPAPIAAIFERPDPRVRELEGLDKNIGAPGAEPLWLADAKKPKTSTQFHLNGLSFLFDANAGQKTGAFLDQSANYAASADWVRRLSAANSGWKGRALDVCCYQGGFALHLARVCKQVTGIDASHASLEVAERNFAANRAELKAEVDWIEADAFEILRDWSNFSGGAGERFDAIVLDPPAFAKSKRAAEGALRGYKELNLRAIRLLAPGGTLITCSCSHHVSLADFTEIVAAAAADTGRRVQLLETRAAAPDHPEVLTLPETRYLKCLICRVD